MFRGLKELRVRTNSVLALHLLRRMEVSIVVNLEDSLTDELCQDVMGALVLLGSVSSLSKLLLQILELIKAVLMFLGLSFLGSFVFCDLGL